MVELLYYDRLGGCVPDRVDVRRDHAGHRDGTLAEEPRRDLDIQYADGGALRCGITHLGDSQRALALAGSPSRVARAHRPVRRRVRVTTNVPDEAANYVQRGSRGLGL